MEQLYTTHRSMPANPLLAEAMYLRGTIERMGTGTEEMTKQCVAKGLGKPTFDPNWGFQTIIKRVKSLIATSVTDNDTDRIKKIIELVNSNNKVTIAQMVKFLKVSKSTVLRDMEKLKTSNRIAREGDAKTGYWKINKD